MGNLYCLPPVVQLDCGLAAGTLLARATGFR